jgi:flagellar hook-length control protein FliK
MESAFLNSVPVNSVPVNSVVAETAGPAVVDSQLQQETTGASQFTLFQSYFFKTSVDNAAIDLEVLEQPVVNDTNLRTDVINLQDDINRQVVTVGGQVLPFIPLSQIKPSSALSNTAAQTTSSVSENTNVLTNNVSVAASPVTGTSATIPDSYPADDLFLTREKIITVAELKQGLTVGIAERAGGSESTAGLMQLQSLPGQHEIPEQYMLTTTTTALDRVAHNSLTLNLPANQSDSGAPGSLPGINSNTTYNPVAVSIPGQQPGQFNAEPATITVPLSHAEWDQALGDRVRWLLNQNISSAQINLNPAELGPVGVRISVERDAAHIQFLASHAEVRDVLDATIPRLRDMLGQAGIELLDVSIGQPSSERQQQEYDTGGLQDMDNPATAEEKHVDEITSAKHTAVIRLVDYYV